ncbi:DM13 domain-containing protein [Streptomyces bambusae]|uniref:DM13 domain-containing protein n=1 Tax=Streptomyces bambusae TaxID=1550616 RepID=UPI001CFE7938|nr:DM13 domain-containing protein [Streptomyces bambusae]MCB5164284.1 DM13 domain-containing protein [Streptomyces bambusae]
MALKRKRLGLVLGALAVAAVLGGFGLYWFQPWKLWTDTNVDEALPGVSGTPTAAASASPGVQRGLRVLAEGTLISHEHATKGTVKIIELPDGSRILRLEGLDTSDGPDLRVWLTDAPVKPGSDGWHVFDDGKHLSLGKLKGNKGNQNYPIPADTRLADYTSMTIWCDRFDVSFGAAALGRS